MTLQPDGVTFEYDLTFDKNGTFTVHVYALEPGRVSIDHYAGISLSVYDYSENRANVDMRNGSDIKHGTSLNLTSYLLAPQAGIVDLNFYGDDGLEYMINGETQEFFDYFKIQIRDKKPR